MGILHPPPPPPPHDKEEKSNNKKKKKKKKKKTRRRRRFLCVRDDASFSVWRRGNQARVFQPTREPRRKSIVVVVVEIFFVWRRRGRHLSPPPPPRWQRRRRRRGLGSTPQPVGRRLPGRFRRRLSRLRQVPRFQRHEKAGRNLSTD